MLKVGQTCTGIVHSIRYSVGMKLKTKKCSDNFPSAINLVLFFSAFDLPWQSKIDRARTRLLPLHACSLRGVVACAIHMLGVGKTHI